MKIVDLKVAKDLTISKMVCENEAEVEKITRGEFGCEVIETIEGESSRWTRSMETIVKYQGKYFSINWDAGATENQDDDYYDLEFLEVEKPSYVWEVKGCGGDDKSVYL